MCTWDCCRSVCIQHCKLYMDMSMNPCPLDGPTVDGSVPAVGIPALAMQPVSLTAVKHVVTSAQSAGCDPAD